MFSLVLFWGYRVEASPLPSLARKGEEAARMKDHQNGLAKWQEGLERARKSGNLKALDDFLSSIAARYEELGQYEKALDYRQQGLMVQRKMGDRLRESNTLMQIGLDYQFALQYKEAILHYEQGLVIKRALKDRFGEIAALISLGGVYTVLNQYEKALGCYDQALLLERLIDNPGFKHAIISCLSSVYYQIGLYETALEYCEQGIAISRKMKNRSMEGIDLINIGNNYSNLSQPQKALTYYNQALAMAREIKDRTLESTALLCLGRLWKDDLKQPEKAMSYLEQTLSIKRELKDRIGETAVLNVMAALQYDLGQYGKALSFYEKELAVSQELNNPLFIGAALLGLGMTYTSMEQYDKAHQALTECLHLYRKVGVPTTLWLTQYFLGKLGAKKGAPEEAISYYEQALETIESMRAGLSEKEAKTSFIRNKLFVYDEFIEFLRSLHDKNPSKGYDRQSWEIFERKQGRVLLEGIGKSLAKNFRGIPQEIKARETDIETQLAELRLSMGYLLSQPGTDQTTEQIMKVEKKISQLKSESQSLQEEIKAKYPDYYALKYPRPATLKELQDNILRPDEVILVYGVTEKATYAWLISKNKFGLYFIGISEGELIEKVNEFKNGPEKISDAIQDGKPLSIINQISQDSLREMRTIGQNIYDLLFPKGVRTVISGAKTLYLVPTGPLYALPFEALTTSSSGTPDPTYLIEQHPIAYLSSASLLKTLRQAEATRDRRAKYPLLIFANPVYQGISGGLMASRGSPQDWRTRAYLNLMGGTFPPLPETEEEAKEIKAIMEAPDKSQPLQLGKAASRWNVLHLQQQNRLEDYRYVVFACHGILPDEVDQVKQPALVLSHPDPNTHKEGYLTMADIFGLKLNADLVTLSACNTGKGTVAKGEGVIGLTRAFMFAGTAAVTVTLWSVESESAKLLTTGLFKDVKAGKSRAEALQNIKLELIKGKKGNVYQHPFFWAPMIIFGDAKGS